MTTARVIATSEIVKIPVNEYHENRHIYDHANSGLVYARCKLTGNTVELSQADYELQKDMYQCFTEGTVTVTNKITGEKQRMACDEYEQKKDTYGTHLTGTVKVTLISTGERVRIPASEYHENKELYSRHNAGVTYVRSIHKIGSYKHATDYILEPHEVFATGQIWVHNPTTGESKRLYKNETVDEGWFGGKHITPDSRVKRKKK
jgi:hypothetical protein